MATKKKLIPVKPQKKFKLSDAMVTQLDPAAKYLITLQGVDVTQNLVDDIRKAWKKVLGDESKAFVFAYTEDIELELYEVKP